MKTESTGGKYHLSENKKHHVLIVLIHHLGGTPEQLKYHVAFLNQSGFDVYTYPAFLCGTGDRWRDLFSLIKKNKIGILEIWAKELEQQLNSLPGSKVIFSFSLPSASALLVSAKRKDIKAFISDGGPFLDLPMVSWRLFFLSLSNYRIFFKNISDN